MNSFLNTPQIEELSYFDPYELLSEDNTIIDEDDYGYDDSSFNDYMNSGNDF
jgi:hypothetical protein